jgi:hypothetical protein
MGNEARPMTREYALISLKAGMLAAAIDFHLGTGSEYTKIIREAVWDLTPAFLEEIKRLALAAGLPPSEMDAIQAELDEINDDEFITRLLDLQELSDRAHGMKPSAPSGTVS